MAESPNVVVVSGATAIVEVDCAVGSSTSVVVTTLIDGAPNAVGASEAETAPIEVESIVEPVEQTTVEEQPLRPDLDVPDLGDGIADVLAESGYTQFVGSDELTESLPDDVVQVLITEDAVLVIPSEEEGE